ncbi:MAG: monovalent cation/H(+) antiporter subunit G [Candidatus Aminicenantes bacterium]|nr:monovalent cation/H(+) antiporter subunit G [Candidatus Aminicenantes bacterium]
MGFFDVIAILVISGGVFFLLVGSIGLIRLPDFFSRSNASGKADTLGILLVLFGLILHEGISLNSGKLLIILTFVALTNPTATHALARATFYLRHRLPPGEKNERRSEDK